MKENYRILTMNIGAKIIGHIMCLGNSLIQFDNRKNANCWGMGLGSGSSGFSVYNVVAHKLQS